MSDVPPTDAIPPADPTGALPPSSGDAGGPSIELWGWLSLLAVLGVLLGLLVDEDGVNLWDLSEAWSVFALVCAVALLAPLLRRSLKWSDDRAWTVAAVGAAGLVLYWLLIVLPVIARNTSFAITVAAAAAVGAAWLAPGRRDLMP